MKFTIGEFSEETGISIHTLRYYEKEGLIHPERLDNGRRIYSDSDVSWMGFIKRLKETNMPIKEIQKYARLREMGESSLEARMELLIKHRASLLDEITSLQEHLAKLDSKIHFYQESIVSRNAEVQMLETQTDKSM